MPNKWTKNVEIELLLPLYKFLMADNCTVSNSTQSKPRER